VQGESGEEEGEEEGNLGDGDEVAVLGSHHVIGFVCEAADVAIAEGAVVLCRLRRGAGRDGMGLRRRT
jgi:hypothetical protein